MGKAHASGPKKGGKKNIGGVEEEERRISLKANGIWFEEARIGLIELTGASTEHDGTTTRPHTDIARRVGTFLGGYSTYLIMLTMD